MKDLNMFSIDLGDFLNNLLSFGFKHYKVDLLIFACFRLLGTFRMLNGPNLFSTPFFLETEDREKSKPT
jgi:hypothetical protein